MPIPKFQVVARWARYFGKLGGEYDGWYEEARRLNTFPEEGPKGPDGPAPEWAYSMRHCMSPLFRLQHGFRPVVIISSPFPSVVNVEKGQFGLVKTHENTCLSQDG